ncbi:uncharacterized protein LOC111706184 [Eurytemora carolleeae]|uniref:uncharacterized protein LOC111706184 n=1 Tax=Eurytemora carolleeae TaxID=1294199 RepID=UPI000C7872F8|nr:uncharacterized protein LOC111706184 [Eurytemora carolleeae]|eukprot:XP_023334755.1 uncharacterized protein LOC111706184 [Eurytemora affinis]
MGGSGIGSTPSMDPVERMVGEEGGKQDQEQESGIGFDDESPLEPRWRGVFTFHPEQTPEGESGIEHNLELIQVNSVPRKDGKPSGFNWNPGSYILLFCMFICSFVHLFV